MISAFTNLPPEVIVFLTSMLPVVELRGAIPVGLSLGVPPLSTYFLAVVGNFIPVPLVWVLVNPISHWLRHIPRVRCLWEGYLARTRSKGSNLERYGLVGLTLFVAVPLPSTGGWTGAVLASLFGFGLFQTCVSVFLGIALAGLIVMILCLLGILGMGLSR